MNFILLSNWIVSSANSAANTIRYVFICIFGLINLLNFMKFIANNWWLSWNGLCLSILDILGILLVISGHRGVPIDNIQSPLVGLIHMVWQF